MLRKCRTRAQYHKGCLEREKYVDHKTGIEIAAALIKSIFFANSTVVAIGGQYTLKLRWRPLGLDGTAAQNQSLTKILI